MAMMLGSDSQQALADRMSYLANRPLNPEPFTAEHRAAYFAFAGINEEHLARRCHKNGWTYEAVALFADTERLWGVPATDLVAQLQAAFDRRLTGAHYIAYVETYSARATASSDPDDENEERSAPFEWFLAIGPRGGSATANAFRVALVLIAPHSSDTTGNDYVHQHLTAIDFAASAYASLEPHLTQHDPQWLACLARIHSSQPDYGSSHIGAFAANNLEQMGFLALLSD